MSCSVALSTCAGDATGSRAGRAGAAEVLAFFTSVNFTPFKLIFQYIQTISAYILHVMTGTVVISINCITQRRR